MSKLLVIIAFIELAAFISFIIHLVFYKKIASENRIIKWWWLWGIIPMHYFSIKIFLTLSAKPADDPKIKKYKKLSNIFLIGFYSLIAIVFIVYFFSDNW